MFKEVLGSWVEYILFTFYSPFQHSPFTTLKAYNQTVRKWQTKTVEFCHLENCLFSQIENLIYELNPSINLLHRHSNLFLMLVESDLQLRQALSTTFFQYQSV